MTTTELSSALRAAADRLWTAQATGSPCAPVRDLIGTVDEAYAVQQHNIGRALGEGGRLIGRKIGLTSPAVQQQLGVDQPDYGALFAHLTTDSDTPVPIRGLLQPKAEYGLFAVEMADLARSEQNYRENTAILLTRLAGLRSA